MRRKIPSTQSLACFEAAARHESYTRAADELGLTQSAVSRQILALESFLGLPLFRRTRHGVALTPAGANYWRQVARGLQGLERDTLDTMAGHGRGGAVALAAVPTFATRWLMPRLPLLAERHPDIVVHIETQTRPFLFADTGFDAALYTGTAEQVAHWPGTRAMRLFDEEIVPVCSPRLSPGCCTPAELARMPLLQQSTRPYGWRHWFESFGVVAPEALQGPRYELFSMLAVAARHGMGVALIPRLLIEAELAQGELVVACPHPRVGERAYYLVQPAAAEAPPAVEAFCAWLRDLCAAGAAT
ncbi:LysR substrate-binding domain-containing protein [uncultured Xylophilus sp.]|uniref:LysR substrate-binding domain-containing protein n=1 Tax=uncultured Xylophilus sp. TaxID=296832 RepID=UPI0025CF9D66|nr:LysR substrate-binding domain-containing protein [uncultured Xylophilus sp.]